MNEVKRRQRRTGMVALVLLGAATAEAVDANDRFKGGNYDGYGKQDTAALGIPAQPPKGTMISVK